MQIKSIPHPWFALICGVIFLVAAAIVLVGGLTVAIRPHENAGLNKDAWQFWNKSLVVMVIAGAGFVLSVLG